jgi:multiple sugar transport system ATP-binding protein
MAQIEFKNVKKSYDKINVVHDFNLIIKDKEFVVFVGPSGCGKSTTLRMVAGLEEITDGEIKINNRRANDLLPSERSVAMVFQDYALYPHLSVFENIAFPLRLKKTAEEQVQRRVRATSKMLDLDLLLDRKPAALSGGQRQRVAMGRAIIKKPDILLFDEPLSNLDAKLRQKMRLEIKKFHHQNPTTCIYVTHDQMEAMTLADRIVVMKDGFIEQVGTPLEVFEKPKNVFVATFIGGPGMNLLECEIKKTIDKTYVIGKEGAFRFSVPGEKAQKVSDGQKILMGIRPSDIFIAVDDPKYSQWETSGKVEFVELLGKNAFLTLKIGDYECVGEIPGRCAPEVGSIVKIDFNLDHLQFFDVKSGVCVTV